MQNSLLQPLTNPGNTLSSGHLLTDISGKVIGGTELASHIQPGQTIQSNAVFDFILFGTVLAPHGLVQGMKTIFPGEQTAANDKKPYQKLNLELLRLTAEEYVNLWDGMIEQILADFKGSDKALLLSGGIDSAIILSYLTPQKDMTCITWSAAMETDSRQMMDKQFSKISAASFGVTRHEIVYMDYARDVEAYRAFIARSRMPYVFSMTTPFIRMMERAQSLGIRVCANGQNVDTLFLAYPAPIHVANAQRLHRLLPIKLLAPFIQKRYKYLLQEKSILREFAFFKSAGVFPGPWVNVPETYFAQHEQELKNFLPAGKNLEQRLLLIESFVTEPLDRLREIPRFWGIETLCPFYHDDFISSLMRMPPELHRRAHKYHKELFHLFAAKRGVPKSVIEHKKKGLSYSKKHVLDNRLHLPVWDAMEHNEYLNHFIDVRSLRQKKQDDYYTFDLLRSLHVWFEEVAKPLNLKLEA